MKEILAFIRPNMYFKTKQALTDNRIYAFSTCEVLGRGKANVSAKTIDDSVDSSYETDFVAKKALEIFVNDDKKDQVIEIIKSVNSTGHHGDGKIFVLPLSDVIRIHTNESGEEALI